MKRHWASSWARVALACIAMLVTPFTVGAQSGSSVQFTHVACGTQVINPMLGQNLFTRVYSTRNANVTLTLKNLKTNTTLSAGPFAMAPGSTFEHAWTVFLGCGCNTFEVTAVFADFAFIPTIYETRTQRSILHFNGGFSHIEIGANKYRLLATTGCGTAQETALCSDFIEASQACTDLGEVPWIQTLPVSGPPLTNPEQTISCLDGLEAVIQGRAIASTAEVKITGPRNTVFGVIDPVPVYTEEGMLYPFHADPLLLYAGQNSIQVHVTVTGNGTLIASRVLSICAQAGGVNIQDVAVSPNTVKGGTLVTCSFTVDRPLLEDPEVKIGTIAFTKVSQSGQSYTYQHTAGLTTPQGNPAVVISVTSLGGAQATATSALLTVDTIPPVISPFTAAPSLAREGTTVTAQFTVNEPLRVAPVVLIAGNASTGVDLTAPEYSFDRTLTGQEP